MIDYVCKNKYGFDDLVEIVKILRSDNGCKWDIEQTHSSIRHNFIEEVYEAVAAIDSGDVENLREELGDVLLQVVFHTQMESEKDTFDINDVADAVCKKLILRHPHVFGNIEATNSDEILENWEKIKKQEKGYNSFSDTVVAVAKSLPALMRAQKIQSRAAKCGFDWENINGALDKVYEELDEFKSALTDNSNIKEEFGDILFSCVNLARFIKIDAEETLAGTCEKFTERFAKMENLVRSKGCSLDKLSLSEMDSLWNECK